MGGGVGGKTTGFFVSLVVGDPNGLLFAVWYRWRGGFVVGGFSNVGVGGRRGRLLGIGPLLWQRVCQFVLRKYSLVIQMDRAAAVRQCRSMYIH